MTNPRRADASTISGKLLLSTALLEPILRGWADAVYGSRFLGGPHRVHLFWHYQGNRFLTFLSNVLTDLNLTDMETCYKMVRRDLLQSLELTRDRFGIEPELIAPSRRPREAPASCNGIAESNGLGEKGDVRMGRICKVSQCDVVICGLSSLVGPPLAIGQARQSGGGRVRSFTTHHGRGR